jgi:hypothetical protein
LQAEFAGSCEACVSTNRCQQLALGIWLVRHLLFGSIQSFTLVPGTMRFSPRAGEPGSKNFSGGLGFAARVFTTLQSLAVYFAISHCGTILLVG